MAATACAPRTVDHLIPMLFRSSPARCAGDTCLAVSLLVMMSACGGGAPVAGQAPSGGPEPMTVEVPPTGAAQPGTGIDGTPDLVSLVPTDGPIACAPFSDADRAAILQRLNAARAQARDCGSERYEATGPLVWNTRLEQAARRQSDDMARHDFFSHTGSDGSQIGDRVNRTGYRLRRAGENIAGGQTSDQAALDGWLTSPGHCRNIMQPAYRDVALTCTADEDSTLVRYWTQVFGTSQ